MTKPEVLFSEEEIRARIKALGAEIGSAFEGRELAVVGLMKSCLVFMADMIRAIPLDLTCHTLRVNSARGEGKGQGRTEIMYSSTIPYEDRDILLLDDIVDTGITLNFLLDHIRVGPKVPAPAAFALPLEVPGDARIPGGPTVQIRLHGGPARSGAQRAVVALPPGTLLLSLRTRRPGDRVFVRGRAVSLKRFLMDHKVPADARPGLALVASGPDVLFMPGVPVESPPGGRFVTLQVVE